MGTEDAADRRHPTESCKNKRHHEHLQSFPVAAKLVLVHYLQLVLQQELGLLGSEPESGLGLQRWQMVCDWTCSTVTGSPCGWEQGWGCGWGGCAELMGAQQIDKLSFIKSQASFPYIEITCSLVQAVEMQGYIT